MDDGIFSGKVQAMAEIFWQRQLSTNALDEYWVALKHIPNDKWVRTCNLIFKESKFMPNPANILEFYKRIVDEDFRNKPHIPLATGLTAEQILGSKELMKR